MVTAPRPQTRRSRTVYPTGWSGDGERVLFETYDPASLGLWSVGVDGSEPQQLVAGRVGRLLAPLRAPPRVAMRSVATNERTDRPVAGSPLASERGLTGGV